MFGELNKWGVASAWFMEKLNVIVRLVRNVLLGLCEIEEKTRKALGGKKHLADKL
jgi:hypothetical protein